MPVQTTYPGVYIQELPSGVHTIAGVGTSVTAFVGAATSGPVDTPVRITSLAEYVRTFGAPVDEAQPMGHAVSLFFQNGGRQAVVVRAVAADAKAASVTLKDDAAADALTLTANGKGAWANRTPSAGLEVAVDRAGSANPGSLFNVVVAQWALDTRTNAAVKTAEESYPNLSMSPASPRYALDVLGASALVVPSLPGPLTTTTAGHSASAQPLASPTTLPAGRRGLRVAVDYEPPVELTLFAAEAADVDKTPAEIATELQERLDDAGLEATASIDGSGLLQIASNATRDGLGRDRHAWPGRRCDRRPAPRPRLERGGGRRLRRAPAGRHRRRRRGRTVRRAARTAAAWGRPTSSRRPGKAACSPWAPCAFRASTCSACRA